jgi:hypothetical protein
MRWTCPSSPALTGIARATARGAGGGSKRLPGRHGQEGAGAGDLAGRLAGVAAQVAEGRVFVLGEGAEWVLLRAGHRLLQRLGGDDDRALSFQAHVTGARLQWLWC